MFKIMGAILILTSTTLYGVINGYELKKRLKSLQDIRKIMMIIRSKIEHLNMPIDEVFLSISNEMNYPYNFVFEKMHQRIVDEFINDKYEIKEIWETSIKQLCEKSCLSKGEIKDFVEFGENLCFGSSEVLLGVIEIYEESLKKEIDDLMNEMKDKIKVYGWLGVVFGAFVTIILI